jgi:gliding-associated putative ABC transporter substrate-binding component GldG
LGNGNRLLFGELFVSHAIKKMAITNSSRKRQLAVTSAAGLAVAALIAVLINVLSNWVFFRLDLTKNNAYSLSPSSRKLVRELSDPVVVKAYFTPDLPAPYNAYERYVRDLLEEYHAASHGKVRYEFALSNPPSEFEKKAGEAGLIPIQFEQMGSDQVQIRRGYMGLVLFHRDKSETLPIIKDVQQLEYDLTSRIAKMAVRTKKVIAMTSGHSELSFQQGARGQSPSRLGEDLKELYDFSDLPLPSTNTLVVKADALLVIGPKLKMDDKSLWVIDQAIMSGIPAAFLIDSKNLMINQFYLTPLDHGLGDLLKHYGASIGDRVVYDAQCETIGVTQNVSGFAFSTSMRYPYIPLVDRIALNTPITRGLDAIGLPFVTTVDGIPGGVSGVHFTPLLFSTQRSWLSADQPFASVSPNNIPDPKPTDPHGPYTLAAVLDGNFTSYFQGKPIPVPGQTLIGTSPKTQIFVIGTSRMLDPNLPQFPGGDALISNVLATLSKDETLIGIRTKGEIIRPLKPISAAAHEIIKAATLLSVVALPILLGVWRWRSRQAWRRSISTTYAPKPA